MSIKKWIMLIAACGLMAGLVSAQDATSEATAAATAEATIAVTSEATVEATAAATSEAPVEATAAATAEAPAATQEAQIQNPDGKTPQELCDSATITDPETREYPTGPDKVIEPGVDYRAVFCTSAGPIYVDLLEDIAPKTVNNFVFLSQQGYYNNSNFHRVLADFMAQGGDPVGNPPGTGGPGYSFEDEFAGYVTFDRPGLLAMANTGQPTSNGSQFFITTSLPSHLTFKHTIFGEVLEGYDNVLAIDLRDPETATEPGEALNTVLIITDPTTVKTTYQAPASELVTSEVAATTLNGVVTTNPLPEGLVSGEPQGEIAIADVIAALPEEVQEAATTYYESHGHQYRVTQSVVNEQCNAQYVFTSLTYTIDAYATSEDATAALTDPALDDINAAEGFTAEDSFSKVFTRPVTDCAGAEAKEGRVYLQRGHYVAVVEGIFPLSFLGEGPMEAVLSQTAITFEVPLIDIYRNER